MADLTWADVVLVGLVGFLGFTLVCYWFSALMTRRGWIWQVKAKKRRGGRQAPRAED